MWVWGLMGGGRMRGLCLNQRVRAHAQRIPARAQPVRRLECRLALSPQECSVPRCSSAKLQASARHHTRRGMERKVWARGLLRTVFAAAPALYRRAAYPAGRARWLA
jgi:hypothetical protein